MIWLRRRARFGDGGGRVESSAGGGLFGSIIDRLVVEIYNINDIVLVMLVLRISMLSSITDEFIPSATNPPPHPPL